MKTWSKGSLHESLARVLTYYSTRPVSAHCPTRYPDAQTGLRDRQLHRRGVRLVLDSQRLSAAGLEKT